MPNYIVYTRWILAIETVILIIGLILSFIASDSFKSFYAVCIAIFFAIYIILLLFYTALNGTDVKKVSGGLFVTMLIPFIMTTMLTFIPVITEIFSNTVGYFLLYFFGKYNIGSSEINISQAMDEYLSISIDDNGGAIRRVSMMFLLTKLNSSDENEIKGILNDLGINIDNKVTEEFMNYFKNMVTKKRNIGKYCWYVMSFILSTYLCIKYMVDTLP
jgi:hypothetical protein